MIDQSINFTWTGPDLLNSTGFFLSPGWSGGTLFNGQVLAIEMLLTGIFTILTMWFFCWLFLKFRWTRRIME